MNEAPGSPGSVGRPARSPGRQAASAYLQQLLLKPGEYRHAWERYVVRARPGAINQLAVAEVLAQYLRTREPADLRPLQIKDTVSRALSGRMLSRPALALFIAAFRFSDHEADRLWRLWDGTGRISVLAGSHAMPPQAEEHVDRVLGPPRYQTMSLHDHVFVGADGRMERTRTIQVIEAVAAKVESIPFLYDTSALTVEVSRGCSGLSGELQQLRPDVFVTDILLASTLGLGETATLEYWTTYRLPGDLTDAREREYRRGVLRHMENFDMSVEFHPDRLPAQVWWATWDGVEGEILHQQEVTLDSQHAAQRFMRSVDRAVVGFRWRW
ncbi:MAG: hypothetical protein ACLQFR_03275 [Streptosporangiaceae bacterium]